MTRITRVCAASLLALVPVPLAAQFIETGFVNRSVTLDQAEYRYQVYVPRDYAASARWPVILFLHGAGERGSDGLIQTEVGLGSAIRRFADRYPAIVVFPQVPTTSTWQDLASEVVLAALDHTMTEFATDSTRVYLTGLSMGGNGTWYLAYRYPERFAALVTVCGWVGELFDVPSFIPESSSDPYSVLAERLKRIPIWVFHGDSDSVVPVEESRLIVAALRAVGATVRYTEFPGVDHNSWDSAYRSPELPAWLFAQRRK